MDEQIIGHTIYEKEVRDIKERLKAKGILLVIIKGDRNKDYYEVASMIDAEDLKKIPFFLMALSQRFIEDVKKFFYSDEAKN